MQFLKIRSQISLIAVAAMLAPVSAIAQTGDVEGASGSEIVVTAQRREERSVDVPITITSLNDQQLATANVQQITDIGKVTPALRFDSSSNYIQPSIRGVGNAVVTSGSSGNIGIYVDGFYTPNPLGSSFQLMNVRSVQVLKGPQGTLFGRNTTGGAILVQTVEPSTDAGGQAKVSYGRFGELRAQGYATLGLAERIAVDVEGLYARDSGWQRNVSNGKKVGGYENWSIRLGLKAELSDDVSILLRYLHDAADDPRFLLPSGYRDPAFGSGAPFYVTPGEITYGRNKVATGAHPLDQEVFRSNSDIVQATIKADLGFADLTSYSQYRAENVNSLIDGDYYGTLVYELGLPNDNETWSQELLLTSKPGSPLQYTAGLFYFENTDTYRVYFDYFPAFGIAGRTDATRFGSSTTTRSYAAFADLTYEITPQLFVTAGGRFARDQIDDAYFYNPPSFLLPPGVVLPGFPARQYVKDVNPSAYAKARQEHFTPRFVVRYKPSEETSVYASFTKGYKAALLDVGGGGGNYVRPESINAYEVGAKYSGSGLSVEASGFYYDYKDLQVSLYRFGLAQILNAATSEIYGIDAQFRVDVTDNFQIAAGGAWVHARYKRFEDAPIYTPCLNTVSPARPTGLDGCLAAGTSFPIAPTLLRNSTMQRTPEFTGNVTASYTTPLAGGELLLSGNLYYSSKLFYGPSGIQFPQKAYETLSLRAQWTDPTDRYSLSLWGDNVTNSRYLAAVQYNNSGVAGNWNKPTTYGVEFAVKF